MLQITKQAFRQYLLKFKLHENSVKTIELQVDLNADSFPVFINEFWTARQRQATSIHEVSYRACFKPQLPRFFVELFTQPGDIVYDPFSGRGTTVLEAALLGRNIAANDVNPLSNMLSAPRIEAPTLAEVADRLSSIEINKKAKADIDLSMFYEKKTLSELISIKEYLHNRLTSDKEDNVDRWIRMVATNRLTGHSNGFFSVYTDVL